MPALFALILLLSVPEQTPGPGQDAPASIAPTSEQAGGDWIVAPDMAPAPAPVPRHRYTRLTPAGYEPLPDWALDDPLRYAAQQCRPQVRPEGEEVEACMARIEGRVRTAYAERNPAPPRSPQASCRRESQRYADGSGGSTQIICGTGEAARSAADELSRR